MHSNQSSKTALKIKIEKCCSLHLGKQKLFKRNQSVNYPSYFHFQTFSSKF